MSHTLYDSPDGAIPNFSIDVTHATAWFFEHDATGEVVGMATVAKDELPAIYRALGEYLGFLAAGVGGTAERPAS